MQLNFAQGPTKNLLVLLSIFAQPSFFLFIHLFLSYFFSVAPYLFAIIII